MKTLKFLGIQPIYDTIQADIDWEELNHRHVKFSWYLNTPPFVEEYHDVELSPFHPFAAFEYFEKFFFFAQPFFADPWIKAAFPIEYSRTLTWYHDEYDASIGGDNHPEEYCYEFDGDEWTRTGDTTYNHAFGGLAEFGKGAVIIGGVASTMTELYDPVKQTFEPKTNWAHLVGPGFGSFSAIGFNDKVYVFGLYIFVPFCTFSDH